ncbi:MAG: hypothetical protein CBB71_09495 [Rhodopirellula sp. TMED11]|nr:MAG: hypothetical protein CBB71_09495 [Rhodopirellula sp. TMED11]
MLQLWQAKKPDRCGWHCQHQRPQQTIQLNASQPSCAVWRFVLPETDSRRTTTDRLRDPATPRLLWDSLAARSW